MMREEKYFSPTTLCAPGCNSMLSIIIIIIGTFKVLFNSDSSIRLETDDGKYLAIITKYYLECVSNNVLVAQTGYFHSPLV